MSQGISLKLAGALVIPYGFILASSYLVGYWSVVGVDPFNYVNAADLVTATLGALALLFTYVSLFAVLGLAVGFAGRQAKLNPAASRRYRKLYYSMAAILLLGCLSLVTLAFIFNRGVLPFALFMSGLIAVAYMAPLALVAGRIDFERPFSIPIRVALFMVVFPAFFTALGITMMDRRLDSGSSLVEISQSNIEVPVDKGTIYIGMLGDFHFLYDRTNNRTMIVPSSRTITFTTRRRRW